MNFERRVLDTNRKIRLLRYWTLLVVMAVGCTGAGAQTEMPDSVLTSVNDSIFELAPLDSLLGGEQVMQQDSAEIVAADSTVVALPKARLRRTTRDWTAWQPNPQRALWLAMVIPGAGQIYNRKYWKLPLVYGGFMGCVYAMSWNNMMYKDYSQAYLDIMDDDPGTQSYNQFLHLGRQITPANEDRYKQLFKKRKDRYRRYRDLSFFVMVGVYALSVIDAYVDAELSVFDISKDLSLRVEPTVLGTPVNNAPLNASSLGLSCSINF